MGDAGVDLSNKDNAFYGSPAIIYDNVFVTLKERNISIGQPDDLDGLTIASFQGAEKRYPDWLKKVAAEKRFFGVSDQLVQIKLLNLKRYDAVLSDRYIFRFFLNQAKNNPELNVFPVTEHDFVKAKPNDYRPVFFKATIRDDFNHGLSELKKSGRFQEIYDHYLKGTP